MPLQVLSLTVSSGGETQTTHFRDAWVYTPAERRALLLRSTEQRVQELIQEHAEFVRTWTQQRELRPSYTTRLAQAALVGDLSEAQRVLGLGAALHEQVLINAVKSNRCDVLTFFFDQGCDPISTRALEEAAALGNAEMVALLLEKGNLPNQRAIECAVAMESEAIVGLLLSAYAEQRKKHLIEGVSRLLEGSGRLLDLYQTIEASPADRVEDALDSWLEVNFSGSDSARLEGLRRSLPRLELSPALESATFRRQSGLARLLFQYGAQVTDQALLNAVTFRCLDLVGLYLGWQPTRRGLNTDRALQKAATLGSHPTSGQRLDGAIFKTLLHRGAPFSQGASPSTIRAWHDTLQGLWKNPSTRDWIIASDARYFLWSQELSRAERLLQRV